MVAPAANTDTAEPHTRQAQLTMIIAPCGRRRKTMRFAGACHESWPGGLLGSRQRIDFRLQIGDQIADLLVAQVIHELFGHQ
jgi:hypothetical protein